MVAATEWSETDTKDAKMLALTPCLSKIEKNKLLSLQKFKQEDLTEP